MLTLLLIKILPERAAHFVQTFVEAIEEAHALRLKMMRTHRMGFDS